MAEDFNIDLPALMELFTDWRKINRVLLKNARRYRDPEDIENLYDAIVSLHNYLLGRGNGVPNLETTLQATEDELLKERYDLDEIYITLRKAFTDITIQISTLGIFKKIDKYAEA